MNILKLLIMSLASDRTKNTLNTLANIESSQKKNKN